MKICSRADQIAYERHLDALAVQSDAFDAARIEGRAEGRAAGLEEGRAAGLEEGRAAGLEEGRAAERIQNARNLKANGVPIELIAKSLNLSQQETESLQ